MVSLMSWPARLHGAPLQIRGWPIDKAAELRWHGFCVLRLRREGQGFDLGDGKLQVTCQALDTLEAGVEHINGHHVYVSKTYDQVGIVQCMLCLLITIYKYMYL